MCMCVFVCVKCSHEHFIHCNKDPLFFFTSTLLSLFPCFIRNKKFPFRQYFPRKLPPCGTDRSSSECFSEHCNQVSIIIFLILIIFTFLSFISRTTFKFSKINKPINQPSIYKIYNFSRINSGRKCIY